MGSTAVRIPQPAASAPGRLGQAALRLNEFPGLLKIRTEYCGLPAGRFSVSIRWRGASPLTGPIPPEREERIGKLPQLSCVRACGE